MKPGSADWYNRLSAIQTDLFLAPVGTVYVTPMETYTKNDSAIYHWVNKKSQTWGNGFSDSEVAGSIVWLETKDEPWVLI